MMGCSTHEDVLQPSNSSLKFVSEHKLEIPEPSGLSLGKNNLSLWTVSDPPSNKIYEMDLQGRILRTLNYTGDDLEGIVYDSTKNVLWIVEERKREVVKISIDGIELERHAIPITGNEDNGFEGICFFGGYRFWIVNEKNPGLLLEVNTDFSIHQQYDLNIADDYSGICCDTTDGQFWIVSDESQLLFLWNQKQGLIEKINIPVKKAEGIAIDFKNNFIYIVSDSEEKLHIFKFP